MATNTYTPIGSAISSGSTNTFTFTSIPQTYTDLRLVITSRSLGTGAINGYFTGTTTSMGYVRVYPNQDAGTNCSTTVTYSNQSTGYSNRITAVAAWYAAWEPNNNATSGIFGVSIMDIFNYASTSTFKAALTVGGMDLNATGATAIMGHQYKTTTAITRLDVYPDGPENFATGSTATLYGITAS